MLARARRTTRPGTLELQRREASSSEIVRIDAPRGKEGRGCSPGRSSGSPRHLLSGGGAPDFIRFVFGKPRCAIRRRRLVCLHRTCSRLCGAYPGYRCENDGPAGCHADNFGSLRGHPYDHDRVAGFRPGRAIHLRTRPQRCAPDRQRAVTRGPSQRKEGRIAPVRKRALSVRDPAARVGSGGRANKPPWTL